MYVLIEFTLVCIHGNR
uniref:Uncharacterized protein n=1 Tax=Arundo donax TaxID=35708 RepID=A0A0A9F2D7_ARUDO